MGMFDGQGKGDADRDESGRFLPGNKFWRDASRTAGRPRIFENEEQLQEACFAYFDWVDDNPLWEMKVFGTGLQAKLPHPRAMTIKGMCVHMGVSRRTWDEYRDREEFKEVCETAEAIIFEQKFAGAAAGLFNASIIARDLGLADKKDIDGNLTVEVVDKYGDDSDPE